MTGKDNWTRRINWTLFWTAVGSIAAVAAVLLALGVTPSSDSDSGDDPTGEKARESAPQSSGGSVEKTEANADKAGEELWSGEISLIVDTNYTLDGFPIEPFEGFCDGCIQVNSYSPEPSLQVENGVRAWDESTPPSHEDCVQLLESGPAPLVSLVTSPNAEGVEVGEWACAFSKSNEILRLRYLGESEDEMNFRFMATGWRQPS
jgi:hypothetical protein